MTVITTRLHTDVYFCLVALIALTSTFTLVEGSASLYYTQWHPYGPSRDSYNHRLGRSRRTNFATRNAPGADVILAARRSKKEAPVVVENVSNPELQVPYVSFDDLGPVGKVVASVTQLGVTIVTEYCTGFLTGLFFGTLVGVPGFAFRPMEKGVPQLFMTEVKGRMSRMNVRSLKWAQSLGGVSAIFKGSDCAVRLVRYNKQDEWNDILGSAIAGALFGRKEGPAGMVKGALLWGGMIYVLNGSAMGSKGSLARYTEQPVAEF